MDNFQLKLKMEKQTWSDIQPEFPVHKIIRKQKTFDTSDLYFKKTNEKQEK